MDLFRNHTAIPPSIEILSGLRLFTRQQQQKMERLCNRHCSRKTSKNDAVALPVNISGFRLKNTLIILLLSISLSFESAHSFTRNGSFTYSSSQARAKAFGKYSHQHPFISLKDFPRGGATEEAKSAMTTSSSTALNSLPTAILSSSLDTVTSSLQSGPYGVLALTAVIASVVTPLTLYKRFYGISVAYGFGVAAGGFALSQVFEMTTNSAGGLLALSCMFYGVRLGGYILLRQATRKDGSTSTLKNGTIMERMTFALSLSLFYAFMTTPALYALRNPVSSSIAMGGAYMAWFGAILEAIADLQKYSVKQQQPASSAGETKDKPAASFVGPTSGVYLISRHPNYLGEIIFWVGLLVGGAPSFGASIQAWICSILGVFGIVSIMLKATDGLEGRQKDKYGGQEKYEEWKKQVPSSLIPFIK